MFSSFQKWLSLNKMLSVAMLDISVCLMVYFTVPATSISVPGKIGYMLGRKMII